MIGAVVLYQHSEKNYEDGFFDGSQNASPEVVTKVVNAVYNAEKIVELYPEANAVNGATNSVTIPIRKYDETNDDVIFILNSINTTLYAEWKQWMYIGGGQRCLYASGYASTTVIALDADENELDTVFSDSQGCFQSTINRAAICNLFEKAIPEGTEYLKIVNYGRMGYEADGYDELSSTGSVTNTTATYLKLNLS